MNVKYVDFFLIVFFFFFFFFLTLKIFFSKKGKQKNTYAFIKNQ